MLIAGGCDPNAADYDKRTCLHLAASEGNLAAAELLCGDSQTDINRKDRWGGTALGDGTPRFSGLEPSSTIPRVVPRTLD